MATDECDHLGALVVEWVYEHRTARDGKWIWELTATHPARRRATRWYCPACGHKGKVPNE